jgi:hypothetical protein
MKPRDLAILALGLSLVLALDFADAQTRCPEGRTAAGACVEASRAAALRQRVVVFTQSKLSYTALPVPLSEDRRFETLRNRIRDARFELFRTPGVSCVPTATTAC